MDSNVTEHINKLLFAHKQIKHPNMMQDCGFQLSGSEFGLMSAIRDFSEDNSDDGSLVCAGVAMKNLSSNRNCTPAMITKLVTSLESKGYVKRVSSSEDRRGVKVCITDNGLEVFNSDEKAHTDLINAIAEKMGGDKMVQLLELVNEFIVAGKEVITEKQKNNGKGES